MKIILALLMAVFVIAGCSALANDEVKDLKWFKSDQEAISYGIKEEEIKKEDVIGEIKEGGETFIFYKKKLEDGLGIGLSSISKKDSQYAWYSPDQDVLIKNNSIENYTSEISWVTKTQSGKKYIAYTGLSKDQNLSIETHKGKVTPKTDKNSGIYFYIEPSN